MNRNQAPRTVRSGYVLVVVMAIAAILAITGTGLLSLGLSTYRRALYTSQEIAARSAAEAGVAQASFAMRSYDGINLPAATNESVPECSGGFSYTVAPGSPGRYVVDATGTAGNATKTIHACLAGETLLFCGIAAGQSAQVIGAGQVLPAPGSSRPKLLTNSTTANSVQLDASTVVFDGDVVVGPGGDPATVIQGEEAVHGSISVAPAPTSFPSVTAPAGLPNRGSLVTGTTITQDGQYTDISLAGSSTVVNISGDRTIYVSGSLKVDDFARILVDANSSLKLYVNGSIKFSNNAVVTSADADPTRVLIFGTPGCTSAKIDSGTRFYGGIYVPQATLKIGEAADPGAAEVHGAVAAQRVSKIEQGSKLYYDDRLLKAAIPSGSFSYYVTYWQDN